MSTSDQNGIARWGIPSAATVLNVAWLAIFLGLFIEVLILIVVVSSGKFESMKPFVADVVRKVSWSMIVCVGLALGKSASRLRTPLMGLAGLLAAPTAFIFANALHKAASQALTITGGAQVGPSLVPLVIIKGIEYACLGGALGWISRHSVRRALAYIIAGLGIGFLFGSMTLTLTHYSGSAPASSAALLSLAINEIIHPVGCSLVLMSAEALGQRSFESKPVQLLTPQRLTEKREGPQ
jgi:hypothetical protein